MSDEALGSPLDETSTDARRCSDVGMAPSPRRLSLPDLPPGVTAGRRRAVNTLDHKACALLHSKLKGFHLEDVA